VAAPAPPPPPPAPPPPDFPEKKAAPEPAPDPTDALKTVYFDYDQEQLREDARATLQQNAQWLRSRTGTKVRIEGNADDRGTIEYNLALGQRRADAVRTYLASLGVNTADLEVISYGEEKPAVDGTDESSWAQNRRADFVIVPKP
jgi:peptidoglycan-associated lipoprotein